MKKDERMFEILTQCPLFRGMDAERIGEILSDGNNYVVTFFKKGDVIARHDLSYSGLMIILEGSARGEMLQPSGKIDKIDAIEAPQLIAPAFLFGGYNRLPVDVIAESDVRILTIHRAFIFELMQEHVLILSNFIDILSDRANVWSKRIYFLSFKSLKEKVASFLLESKSDHVALPDIAHIAQVFAATRNSLQIVLDGLEKKHIIAQDDDGITILNRRALEAILK